MTIPVKTATVFFDAIEAAYAVTMMMALGGNKEELASLQEKYQLLEQKYGAIKDEQLRAGWWEKRCKAEPGCAECKCFDC